LIFIANQVNHADETKSFSLLCIFHGQGFRVWMLSVLWNPPRARRRQAELAKAKVHPAAHIFPRRGVTATPGEPGWN
jgi:hypothetical protein